ncbi:amino acid adenylation domain-containing protein [Halomonas sp. DP8Y7-3]|uniref:amino acid adenylation domain-containing protein n=1 Tax=Halomonas sp. DP8Y7-3 TaxID=2859079 RepID=UPI001C985559|nr:amino acid adenylation domain-containing protein [Halomonas sp. DP8Y7-3]MBY5928170.1 amino acid adenylation domain-containing protein [Halomonas sp. DP8Y7-3]
MQTTGNSSAQSRLAPAARQRLPTQEVDADYHDALLGLGALDRTLFRQFSFGPRQALPYRCLHHAFEAQVARYPDTPAIRHGRRHITYAQLNAAADGLATYLQRLGVRPGDSVGLFVRRSIEMVTGMLAVLKCGAAYVPQDVGIAPSHQLEHVVAKAGIQVVLTQHYHHDKIASLLEASTPLVLVDVDPFVSGSSQAPCDQPPARPAIQPDDRCFVLFTSGTTGTPNGVCVSHRNVCNILHLSPGHLGIAPGMVVAQILCIAFDMAAWEVFGALSHGATLLIREDAIVDAMRQADVIIATPSILASVRATDCPRARVVAVAGEPCPRPLADEWASHCRFINACGPTETTIVNTLHEHHPELPALTIGAPTPNNAVYVLDEQLRPLPIGEVGEMWAGGLCVTEGYLDNRGLNAERYRPDPFVAPGPHGPAMMFRTRDLGRWTSQGQLEHLGRTDDQVKIKGFRVELDCVSRVIERHPGCRQAVTLKHQDQLVAFVSPATVNVTAIRRLLAEHLPYYCHPEDIIAVDQLPRTSRGKIDKRALLDQRDGV